MQTDKSPSTAARLRAARPAPEFPGCRPTFLGRDEVANHDGRFEFWDADTETAWMVRDPTSATHEYPSHRIAALSELIASMRGSAIACFGAMDLELRDERGERRRILQADQSVYLHPGRSRLPREAGMVIGEHDFPDVVLEVDHTTDVRRGKLWLYEEWGFPEVWVEVPERYAPSRPAGRLPGLVIHLLEGGRYRTAPESRAFPGVDGGGDPHRPERAGPLGPRPARCSPGWGGRSARARAPAPTTCRGSARSAGRRGPRRGPRP